MISNNRTVDTFAEQLYKCSLPADTEIVTVKAFRDDRYNSQKVEYIAVLLLKTIQSETQIKRHYFSQHFQSVDQNARKPRVEIVKVTGNTFIPHDRGDQVIAFEREPRADYIAVILIDQGEKHSFPFNSIKR